MVQMIILKTEGNTLQNGFEIELKPMITDRLLDINPQENLKTINDQAHKPLPGLRSIVFKKSPEI